MADVTPRAIVWVPESEFPKLAHGIALPDGYAIINRLPFGDANRMSYGFIVESRDIPPTTPGVELPTLSTLPGYQCVVVERWHA